MRSVFFFLPVLLMAQTPPAPKAPATAPAKAPATAPAKAPATVPGTVPKPAVPGAPRPAGATVPKPVPPPMTDEQKIIYSLGLSISKSLAPFDLSPAEMEIVKRALTDAAAKKPAVVLDEWGPKIQGLATSRAARISEKEKGVGAAYCAKAAAEPGAVKTDSGLIYKEVRPGAGESPKATDQVKVHYRGTLVDGTEFDSSYKRNQPAQFALNGVIPCWTEGVQKMKPGGKSILVCPSAIAYGDMGHPPTIPGGAALVFEIELLEIPPVK
jgi:FKBP-type peptidyl-prolyl cis-trans isomerase FkpA